MRSENLLRKHFLPVIQYLFSKNSYGFPIWILYLILTRPKLQCIPILTHVDYRIHIVYLAMCFLIYLVINCFSSRQLLFFPFHSFLTASRSFEG